MQFIWDHIPQGYKYFVTSVGVTGAEIRYTQLRLRYASFLRVNATPVQCRAVLFLSIGFASRFVIGRFLSSIQGEKEEDPQK